MPVSFVESLARRFAETLDGLAMGGIDKSLCKTTQLTDQPVQPVFTTTQLNLLQELLVGAMRGMAEIIGKSLREFKDDLKRLEADLASLKLLQADMVHAKDNPDVDAVLLCSPRERLGGVSLSHDTQKLSKSQKRRRRLLRTAVKKSADVTSSTKEQYLEKPVPISLHTLLFDDRESTCECFCIASDAGDGDASYDADCSADNDLPPGNNAALDSDANVCTACASCMTAPVECVAEKAAVHQWASRRRRKAVQRQLVQAKGADVKFDPHCMFLTFSTEFDTMRAAGSCRLSATSLTCFAISLRFPQQDWYKVFASIPFPWLPGLLKASRLEPGILAPGYFPCEEEG